VESDALTPVAIAVCPPLFFTMLGAAKMNGLKKQRSKYASVAAQRCPELWI
jgi:hypothetical protein